MISGNYLWLSRKNLSFPAFEIYIPNQGAGIYSLSLEGEGQGEGVRLWNHTPSPSLSLKGERRMVFMDGHKLL
jgi:hypothetical protein